MTAYYLNTFLPSVVLFMCRGKSLFVASKKKQKPCSLRIATFAQSPQVRGLLVGIRKLRVQGTVNSPKLRQNCTQFCSQLTSEYIHRWHSRVLCLPVALRGLKILTKDDLPASDMRLLCVNPLEIRPGHCAKPHTSFAEFVGVTWVA